jgi:hypothetical protein
MEDFATLAEEDRLDQLRGLGIVFDHQNERLARGGHCHAFIFSTLRAAANPNISEGQTTRACDVRDIARYFATHRAAGMEVLEGTAAA